MYLQNVATSRPYYCPFPGNKTNHNSKNYSDLRILTEFSADWLNDDKTSSGLCFESRAATSCRRPSVASGGGNP